MTGYRPESLDTGGQILAAQRRAQRWRVIAGLFFSLVLVAALMAVHASSVMLSSRPEWGRYLGVQAQPNATLSCLTDGACRQALFLVSRRVHFVPFHWVAFLGLSSGLVALALSAAALRVKPSKLPGAAKLAQTWEHLTKGISYLGVKEGKILRYPGDLRFRHTLIIGSTGAGKTSRLIRPALAYAAKEGRSAVVIDLKYPDVGLLGMVSVFEAYERQVIVLLPYDKRSPQLPLLRGAEDERVAQKIAEVIIPVEEREGVTSYYANIERELLQRLIHIEATYGKGSLGQIRFVCQRGPDEIQKYIEQKAPDAKSYFGAFFSLSKGKQAEIAWGLVGKLKAFGDPLVDRFTSFGHGEVDLRSATKRPTLVYFGIPQERLQDAGGQILLQLFKRYLDWVFLEESKKTGKLEVPVEVFLDEFTNLGFLPRMSDNLSTMRSRRVAYVLALQSFSQGLERYREEELESIIANCNTWVIFPKALSDIDAERISKALGNTTAFLVADGEHSPHFLDFRSFWPSYSVNYRPEKLPLLSPEEMRNLEGGSVLLRFSDGDPLVAQAPRFDEVLRDPKAPKELRELAAFVAEAERKYQDLLSLDMENAAEFAADYLTGPYLVPQAEDEEETPFEAAARGIQESKKALYEWFAEMVRQGAEVVVHRSPEGKVAKLDLYPPAGLLPEEAENWANAKWVKLSKGKKVIGLVPPALEGFIEAHGDLVEAVDLAGRLRSWVEANARRLEGHPAQDSSQVPIGRWKRNRVVISLDSLAELGISKDLAAKYGKEVRWENKRGFYDLPLTAKEALEGAPSSSPEGQPS